MTKLTEIKDCIENYGLKSIIRVCQEALDDGYSPTEILEAMIAGMETIGREFSDGIIFVPELLIASKTMIKGITVIQPYLEGDGSRIFGKCIIGTVRGDLHDIGKSLVATMIGASGFKVIDLGADVPKEKFVEAINENPDVKIVALSALLTSTMESLNETVSYLKGTFKERSFKIMVGGATVTQELANVIGADGYAVDAGNAAKMARMFINNY